MYDDPRRSKCLDECTVSSPHECHTNRPFPCEIEELTITCKAINTGVLEKDLHDNTLDLSTCEIALSQGLSTCGESALLVKGYPGDLLIKHRVAWNKCFIEVVTKELKNRADKLLKK